MTDDLGDKENEVSERLDILKLLDDFIENVMKIKKTLVGLSLSALVLAPFAVFLSLYLIINPSFFAILAIETEFGLVLFLMLAAVIIISSIWIITGFRHYKTILRWNKKYEEFSKMKREIDKQILSKYGLDEI
ncbi:MAG: hypothetical protein H0X03_01720 [Nitrosopumilus sp.]|nr:hypothetical protein [Nitrosopumilus sp.]